jgi:hypothetical protein
MEKSVVRKFWNEIKAKYQHFTTFLIKRVVSLSSWESGSVSSSAEGKEIEDFLTSSIEK